MLKTKQLRRQDCQKFKKVTNSERSEGPAFGPLSGQRHPPSNVPLAEGDCGLPLRIPNKRCEPAPRGTGKLYRDSHLSRLSGPAEQTPSSPRGAVESIPGSKGGRVLLLC